MYNKPTTSNKLRSRQLQITESNKNNKHVLNRNRLDNKSETKE